MKFTIVLDVASRAEGHMIMSKLALKHTVLSAKAADEAEYKISETKPASEFFKAKVDKSALRDRRKRLLLKKINNGDVKQLENIAKAHKIRVDDKTLGSLRSALTNTITKI